MFKIKRENRIYSLERYENFKYKTKLFLQKAGPKMFIYLLLVTVSFVFIYPFLYMIVTSIKSPKDLFSYSVNWIPTKFFYANYLVSINIMRYWKFLKNSLLIVTAATLGHVISGSFIGYGYARFDFKFKKFFYAMVILAIIIPVQTIIIPQYLQFSKLGFIDSYKPIIIPTFFGYGLRGALYIFIFRSFYTTLPKELENAAYIDGCGFFKTYWKVVFPLTKSSIVVTTILSLVWHWNDYYEPVIYVREQAIYPLPARLNQIYNAVASAYDVTTGGVHEYGNNLVYYGDMAIPIEENTAIIMASTFLVILPVLIIFSVLQNQFVQGIERTGMVE